MCACKVSIVVIHPDRHKSFTVGDPRGLFDAIPPAPSRAMGSRDALFVAQQDTAPSFASEMNISQCLNSFSSPGTMSAASSQMTSCDSPFDFPLLDLSGSMASPFALEPTTNDTDNGFLESLFVDDMLSRQ